MALHESMERAPYSWINGMAHQVQCLTGSLEELLMRATLRMRSAVDKTLDNEESMRLRHAMWESLQPNHEPLGPTNAAYFRRVARHLSGKRNPALAEELTLFDACARVEDFDPSYLLPFFKGDRKPSEAHVERFGMHRDIIRRIVPFGKRHAAVFYDSEFQLWLTYEHVPLAHVGFDARKGTAFINQLQGVKRPFYQTTDPLDGLAWPLALASYVADAWSPAYGIPKVAIQAAEHNAWVGENHLPLDAAKARYNGTARRLGFAKNENGDYERLPGAGDSAIGRAA